jgi:hypothetical protein
MCHSATLCPTSDPCAIRPLFARLPQKEHTRCRLNCALQNGFPYEVFSWSKHGGCARLGPPSDISLLTWYGWPFQQPASNSQVDSAALSNGTSVATSNPQATGLVSSCIIEPLARRVFATGSCASIQDTSVGFHGQCERIVWEFGSILLQFTLRDSSGEVKTEDTACVLAKDHPGRLKSTANACNTPFLQAAAGGHLNHQIPLRAPKP